MSNSVWFITGSSRGLGRALASAVLDAGHRVVATARRTGDLQFLVDRHGPRVHPVALDVTDAGRAHAAVAAAVAAYGRIDVVVNNAGYANVSSLEDMPEADFRAQIETNFFGVVNVTRAVLPVLRAQGAGRILQISSIGGRLGSPGLGAYQAAKWAVGGFSEALAAEVAPLGIRITIVEPGGMKTDFAGTSMHIHATTPAYEPTVGAFWRRRGDAGARGDVAKITAALLELAGVREPPLHLLLGSDAQLLARVARDRRAAEDAAWHALGASTDADGLGDFADTPVGRMLVASQQR